MSSDHTRVGGSSATRLQDLSAVELLAAYRAGTLSPVEVTREVLAHIARCEPKLQATYALNEEAAMAAAQASEARWRAGAPLTCGGVSLDGVPATIKENIATRGVPVPVGTAATELVPAAADAPAAARLREAGAVILCKTTMPEYGMLSSGVSSFHPLTRNPWNLDLNPGGSSAGAGAAAAAGYGPLHLGTDIGGSVRLPAAWCGVIGLKPSLGRVPVDPPYMARAIGPMTRTVGDAALLMSVVSQPDPEERDHMNLPPQAIDWMNLDVDLKGVRIGLLTDAGCGLPTEPEVVLAVEEAARRFADAGAIVELIRPWMNNEMLHGIDTFWRLRSFLDIQALPEARRDKLVPIVREWAEAARNTSGEAAFKGYSQTVNTRARTVAATKGYDFVLSPVSPNISFPAQWAYPSNDVRSAMDHIGYTVPFSMSEQPAVSVPCGVDRNGVPIGLQIAGHRFDDLGVLRMARAWERIAPPARPWPMSA